MEVIISLFIVAMGSTISTNLIVSAIQSNAFSRDNLIALNLTVEGIEAVRNVRDTNWIKFSYDRANCWKMLPEKAQDDTCNAGNSLSAGFYTVDLDVTNMQWNMQKITLSPNGLELSDGINVTEDEDEFRLDFLDLDGGSEKEIYVSKAVADFPPGSAKDTGESQFYRMVKIELDGVDKMTVTSLVQWETRGTVHQVQLWTKLTNYNKIKVT